MCRSKDEGGRRCPAHTLTPDEEAARKAARKVANHRYYAKKRAAVGKTAKQRSPLGRAAVAVDAAVELVEIADNVREAAKIDVASTQTATRVPGYDGDVFIWTESDLAALPNQTQTAVRVAYARALGMLSEAQQDAFLDAREADPTLWLVGLPDRS